jgi:hypothetical protein
MDKTWINLCPFIQESYQQRITSGTMTSAQGGYTGGGNHFTGLTAKEDDVSDDNTAETIAGTINLHMANLLLQTAATIEASRTQVNATLQQMATNQAQLQQQQQQMMQQMAMMLFACQQNASRSNTAYVPPPAAPQAYAPPPWAPMPYQQGFQQPGGGFAMQQPGGHGGHSHGGCNRRARGGGRGGIPIPMPLIGGNQMIPYIPGGAQQQLQPPPNRGFSNIIKLFANQNVCFTCGFNVEDLHTSTTCPNKKLGHQDGFTHSNYMEYERANHPISFAGRGCTSRCTPACDGVGQ